MRCLALLALLALAACTATEHDELRPRFGVAAGQRFVSLSQDLDDPDGTRDLDQADAVSGFFEAGANKEHVQSSWRGKGARTRHDAPGFANAVAEYENGLALFLIGQRVPIASWLEVRGLFGFGLGYGSLDYGGALGLENESDLYGAVGAALELGLFDHLFGGAMGWAGIGGHPGESDFESSSLMVYAGVRF